MIKRIKYLLILTLLLSLIIISYLLKISITPLIIPTIEFLLVLIVVVLLFKIKKILYEIENDLKTIIENINKIK